MSREKPGCLLICSAHQKGVTAQSFIHSFTLTSSAFNVFLTTPGGAPVEFVNIDDSNRQWITDFRSKGLSNPHKLEEIDSSKFMTLVIPDSPGALFDLSNNAELAGIINSFTRDKKPMCAIGYGVAALFSTLDIHSQKWYFDKHSLTAPSHAEILKREDFPSLPIVPPDFIRKHGGTYSASPDPSSLYVVVDNFLVTGQNEQSTLTGVQNLILLSNARLARTR
ncbi:PREDICTED: Parkinson disease 7 domain-containing protein 1-like [Amphimedon queenslandica]|uniref:Glutamine amidotransferase-like class 1 domain-containing protein 1 n=1 Tax=Amphimedon queenslandica TaxID=400682 RepID=A0A1X7U8F9_AMPQE|nr:PREDICTED: Parkinson disease 7 domain-containing protein 1-like [Amphimedon queenslandica]|eukprot:XP_011405858.1 PREDICTED: Parkinson disease 7 domain-containing protein 1-like [Amphimedon queenslandica]